MNNNVGGDYDRLTDWIRPLARGLAIYYDNCGCCKMPKYGQLNAVVV